MISEKTLRSKNFKYKLFEIDFYMKVTVTIISTKSVTNSHLTIFCHSRRNKKYKEGTFQQIGSLETKNIYIYCESCPTSKVFTIH